MNTLTNLIPDLYAALDVVSREAVGFIPAVRRDASVDRAAVGQAVRYHVAPSGNGVNISPAMAIPEPTDQTIGSDTVSITKSRAYEFGFVGESQRGLNNNGAGYLSVQADMIAQAMRGLVNEIEVDLSVAATAGASRSTGAPATLPFATNSDNASQLRKILIDNGAPMSELNLVLDTTAGAALRTLYGINADRDWSQAMFNEQGVLTVPHGLAIRETGQGQTHTAGTGASATTDNAGYAVGATTITLASAGTGTILAGDSLTFAGDPHVYRVVTGDTNVANGGTIVLQSPGLRQAIPTAATAITLKATHGVGGIAFHRSAIVLASRAPALPEEGDLALDRMMVTDPRSGLMFEASIYGGYRKVRYELAMSWGVKVVAPRHTALLMR